MKRKSLAVLLSAVLLLSSCNAALVQSYINLAVNIALQVAVLAGVPKSAADKVAADLATVNKLITDYKNADAGAKPGVAGEIDTYLNVAEQDLDGILTVVQVKDPKVIAAVRAGIAIAITAVESIRTIALQHGASVPARVARTAAKTIPLPQIVVPKGKTLTPAQLKDAFNKAVAAYPQAQLK